MNSDAAKVKANQKNAAKSTGPNTDEGKQVVALNGIAHGLRSLNPVIPWLENEEDWLAHRSEFILQLEPCNALESAIADRIALGFWRLARSVETQPRILHAAREKRRWRAIGNTLTLEGIRTHREPAKATFARLLSERDDLCALDKAWGEILKKSKSPADPGIADKVFDSICSSENWSKLGDAFNESFDWPPAKMTDLRSMVDWLIENLDGGTTASVDEYAAAAHSRATVAKELIERIEEESEQAADLALIDSDVMDKLQRYETAIHRTLQKDLHELQRLQGMRSGKDVAIPIAIDLTTEG